MPVPLTQTTNERAQISGSARWCNTPKQLKPQRFNGVGPRGMCCYLPEHVGADCGQPDAVGQPAQVREDAAESLAGRFGGRAHARTRVPHRQFLGAVPAFGSEDPVIFMHAAVISRSSSRGRPGQSRLSDCFLGKQVSRNWLGGLVVTFRLLGLFRPARPDDTDCVSEATEVAV
jgi:hypothetical protein